MIYLSEGSGSMGCSVTELNALSIGPSEKEAFVKKLNKLKGFGITLAVSCDTTPPISEEGLKEAGFICLAVYNNHNEGHFGNKCKLWAAFGPHSLIQLLPDKVAELLKIQDSNLMPVGA